MLEIIETIYLTYISLRSNTRNITKKTIVLKNFFG